MSLFRMREIQLRLRGGGQNPSPCIYVFSKHFNPGEMWITITLKGIFDGKVKLTEEHAGLGLQWSHYEGRGCNWFWKVYRSPVWEFTLYAHTLWGFFSPWKYYLHLLVCSRYPLWLPEDLPALWDVEGKRSNQMIPHSQFSADTELQILTSTL